jgi:hypothetical protein
MMLNIGTVCVLVEINFGLCNDPPAFHRRINRFSEVFQWMGTKNTKNDGFSVVTFSLLNNTKNCWALLSQLYDMNMYLDLQQS